MFSYLWPISLVVLSNVAYQVCAKSVPQGINPFASLTVTYLVGAAASAILYYVLGPGGNLLKEYGKLNWAPRDLSCRAPSWRWCFCLRDISCTMKP